MSAYDVIVIGAGSVGTPTAYFLAKAGIRPLVIDSAASVGQGASKAAIGGVRATHSDVAKIRTCLASLDVFSQWEEEHGDNIEWMQGGYSFVAYRDREEKILKDLLVVQKAHGLGIDWIERDELLGMVPDLEPNGLIGGTFSPGDGSASPLLATHGFFKKAVELGADFAFRETVTAIRTEGGRVVGVTTDKGRFDAPVVINATGGAARAVSQLAGLDVPVQPDSHEAGVTEPVARFLSPMIVDIRPDVGSKNYYFYQHRTGQVIFCITPDPPIVGEDRRETSEFLPMIARRMVRLMPRLRELKVRRTWRGLYPMTPDGSPIVGWAPELKGYVHAVGMCGQGFMLGPGLGQLITRLVREETTEEDRDVLAGFAPEREFAAMEALK
ncbi:MAG: FAD-binding oxidoreductase [Candidatus Eisenbacteria bacterium]|nr:FAD-binding oxidoreductase [Candidatus Eisenbacteria bacterium]